MNTQTKEHTSSQAKVVLRNLRTGARKLNFVASMIRGMDVEEALQQLTFCKRRISNDVRKALLSAIANADNNHYMDVDSLYIKEAYVGRAMVMKRIRARARGRAAKILKPFSNITIILGEREAV